MGHFVHRIIILSFIALIATNLSVSAQSQYYTSVPFTTTDSTQKVFVTRTNQQSMLMVYREATRLLFTNSFDNGAQWGTPLSIDTTIGSTLTAPILDGVSLPSGRILIVYRVNNSEIKTRYTSNGGLNWSSGIILPLSGTTLQKANVRGTLAHIANDTVVFTYLQQGILNFIRSTDGGNTWAAPVMISSVIRNELTSVHLCAVSSENWIISGSGKIGLVDSLFILSSSNSGAVWSSLKKISNGGKSARNPRIVKNQSSGILMYYELETSGFSQFPNFDIVYSSSLDNGVTWNTPVAITRFKGNDRNFLIDNRENVSYLTFLSNRRSDGETIGTLYRAYTGVAQQSYDKYVYPFTGSISIPEIGAKPVTLVQKIFSSNEVKSVTAFISLDDTVQVPVTLYDDGTHGDLTAADGNYTGLLNGLLIPTRTYNYNLNYSFKIIDSDANTVLTRLKNVNLQPSLSQTSLKVTAGSFSFPFNSQGVLADVITPTSGPGGFFDNVVVLFSSGFFLSGVAGQTVWSNGVLSASRIGDYLPGQVNATQNNIFVVKNSDVAFGNSWHLWRFAVLSGAKFYDGDGDGKYIPVDKNGNGIWDANEDRPDILGDFTYYTVFSDKVEMSSRRFSDVPVYGIEIRQTIFGWNNSNKPELYNTFFVRYEIVNRNSSFPVHDSVYFGIAQDPDLGSYQDDLVGSDFELQTGYVYNKVPDPLFGTSTPALFAKYFYGPQYSKAGETYTDVNGNGKYDSGVDIPLSEAKLKNGMYLGEKTIPGYKNLRMTSFTQYMSSHPTHGDPNTKTELRNYLIGGRSKDGVPINPCTWSYGNGSTLANCASLDKNFMYSGDPSTGAGWLNTSQQDQRMILSAGPFKLEYQKPVEVLYCIMPARAATGVQSVVLGKQYLRLLDTLVQNNFAGLSPEAEEDIPLTLDDSNFPNPFNPVTTISFSLPSKGQVTLKVYDILGREIKTLTDGILEAGKHQVVFSAQGLASGVYIYSLKTNIGQSVKKMILAK